MRDKSKILILSVPKGSNLDGILRGFICAFNGFTEVLGVGMNAIALALSTPQDNSAEVQKVLDQIAAEINASSDTVEATIDEHSKGDNRHGS